MTDDCGRSRRSRRSRSLPARPAVPVRPGGGGRCSPTTRRTAARLRAGQRQPHAVRQGRLPPPICPRRATAIEPRRLGTKARDPLPVRRDPARRVGRAAVAALDRPADLARRSTTWTTIDRRAQGRGRRVLRGDPPAEATADERLIQRQALAGLLWNKQTYIFDVHVWLDGDNPDAPPPPSRQTIRNSTGGTSTRCG